MTFPSTTPPTASQRIARFASGFDPQRLDAADLNACARSWLDTVACAIAGAGEPATLRAKAYLEAVHGLETATPDRPRSARARLWGATTCTSIEAAALFNGIAGHVLDYDDVTSPMRGHPSIALWPALMAIADARDLPGRRLASAFAVGFEVICKLSRTMAFAHYAQGWHSTSSIGTLGATAACAHLIGLDEAQTVNALGLAVAQSAGTRQNFGSDAKSFQAGMCGASAARAALLAEQGFDAAADAIDGEFGYMALVAHGEDLQAGLSSLGATPLELHASGFEIKQYPMCYAAHRAIDGVLELRRAFGLTLDRVAAVRITTSAGGLVPLIHHRPVTGLQAKFSMEYAVAAALADGAVGLASFEDAAVRREAVAAFLPQVTASEATGALLPRFAEVSMRLADGRDLGTKVLFQHGSAERPLSDEQLVAKAQDCLKHGGRSIDATELYRTAQRMATLPARALIDALNPTPTGTSPGTA